MARAYVLLTAVLMLSPAICAAATSRLVAGPMPGHSGMRAVSLWLQTDGPAEVRIEYWPASADATPRETQPVHLVPGERFAVRVDIGGLVPGKSYAYRVLIDGQDALPGESLQFHTQPLWQRRTDPPPFRAAVGSCAFINDTPYDWPGTPFGEHFGIFDVIASRRPDLMLWLGDHVYLREADYDAPWGMDARYRQVRAYPPLQRLLRATHHYAIWDDHDYGPNNSNRSFPLKGHSLRLFRRYWANPGYGLPETPGTFTRFSYRGVDFFLLDNRYYRHSDRAPSSPEKTMLGEAQLAWLKDALLDSHARLKIVASGSQMLKQASRAEGWHHFPQERSDFLDWLGQTRVEGLVFLSGDRHYTELLKRTREDSYPLYELTCSPLTSKPRTPTPALESRDAVAGTRVSERNFCQLDFAGPLQDRQLNIRVFDSQGQPLWQRTLQAAELSYDD